MAKSWHRRAPAFWNLFSAFHRPVGVVGWWASWPAEQVEGVMVSSSIGLRGHRGIRQIGLDDKSWFARRHDLTYPDSYTQVVADEIGLPEDMDDWFEAELFPYREVPLLDAGDLDTLLSVVWQDRLYLKTTLHLLETEKLSVTTTYFEGIDALSHHFWQFIDHPQAIHDEMDAALPPDFDAHRYVVDRYYEIVDGYLGELLAAAGDDATVMLVSDHGFRDDSTNPHGADHSPYGVLVLAGPGVRRGENLDLSLPGSLAALDHRIGVLDVLPTLLYLHGLPISTELPGEPIFRALERGFVDGRPELTVPSYGDFASSREVEVESADEEEYLQRMKALGYIR